MILCRSKERVFADEVVKRNQWQTSSSEKGLGWNNRTLSLRACHVGGRRAACEVKITTKSPHGQVWFSAPAPVWARLKVPQGNLVVILGLPADAQLGVYQTKVERWGLQRTLKNFVVSVWSLDDWQFILFSLMEKNGESRKHKIPYLRFRPHLCDSLYNHSWSYKICPAILPLFDLFLAPASLSPFSLSSVLHSIPLHSLSVYLSLCIAFVHLIAFHSP